MSTLRKFRGLVVATVTMTALLAGNLAMPAAPGAEYCDAPQTTTSEVGIADLGGMVVQKRRYFSVVNLGSMTVTGQRTTAVAMSQDPRSLARSF